MLNLARDKTSPSENAMALKIKLIRLSQTTSIDPPRSLTQQDCLFLKSFNKNHGLQARTREGGLSRLNLKQQTGTQFENNKKKQKC